MAMIFVRGTSATWHQTHDSGWSGHDYLHLVGSCCSIPQFMPSAFSHVNDIHAVLASEATKKGQTPEQSWQIHTWRHAPHQYAPSRILLALASGRLLAI